MQWRQDDVRSVDRDSVEERAQSELQAAYDGAPIKFIPAWYTQPNGKWRLIATARAMTVGEVMSAMKSRA